MLNSKLIVNPKQSLFAVDSSINNLVRFLSTCGFKNFVQNSEFSYFTDGSEVIIPFWESNTIITHSNFYKLKGGAKFILNRDQKIFQKIYGLRKTYCLDPFNSNYTLIVIFKSSGPVEIKIDGKITLLSSSDYKVPKVNESCSFECDESEELSFKNFDTTVYPEGTTVLVKQFKFVGSNIDEQKYQIVNSEKHWEPITLPDRIFDVVVSITSKEDRNEIEIFDVKLYEGLFEFIGKFDDNSSIENAVIFDGYLWRITKDGKNYYPIMIEDDSTKSAISSIADEQISEKVPGIIKEKLTLFTEGNQKGIKVQYNPETETADFIVNSFKINLSGDVEGSSEVIHNSDVTIYTSIGDISDRYAKTDLSNVDSINILEKIRLVDGPNSGLNADLLDGKHADQFPDLTLSNVDDQIILEKVKRVDGPNSGLDSDTVDGKHANEFALNDLSNVDDIIVWNKARAAVPELNADKLEGYRASDFAMKDLHNVLKSDFAAKYSEIIKVQRFEKTGILDRITQVVIVDASSDVFLTIPQDFIHNFLIVKRIDSTSNTVKIRPSSGSIDATSEKEIPPNSSVILVKYLNSWYSL